MAQTSSPFPYIDVIAELILTCLNVIPGWSKYQYLKTNYVDVDFKYVD